MGMDSRVVPTSGGRKALHENSSLEQVQALVKRFYGLKPATTQQDNGELINLLDEAKSLLSMRDPSCLIGLLAFILRYVIPVWVLPLRDEDQARWLDDLVGPHSPSPRWCVWVALCEALAGRGGDDHGFVHGPSSPVVGQVAQGRGREKAALEFIVQRLRGMVGGEGWELRTALHELLGLFPSTPDGLGTQQVSTPPADVERVMQSLLLLPARLANASHTAASEGPARRIDGGEEGTKDVFFKPENYYEAVTRAVLQVCVQSCGAGARAGAVSLWSHFVLKAARMGQAGTVARVWVQAMKHQGEEERGCSVDLFKGLALPCLEGVMVELIRCLCGEYADAEERQARFNALVVPALADEDGLPSLVLLIRSKLLLARVLSPAAATLLVNAVAEAGEAHLVKLMSAILQVWKARTFLQRSDVAGQQAYVTAALLACLARMTKDTLQAAEGGAVLGDVLEGVGAHLESAILGTRRHGMTVAEAFAKVMGQELRFDELDGHRGGNGPSSPNDGATPAEPATENGESGAAHPNERVGVEGDLEPYDDLSDDDEEDLRPVPVPRYLRRLIELLRVKDDDAAFDKHSTALAEAAALIASSPSDLPDLSPALTRDLLTLENRFDMPGFAEHRHAALMALVAGDPDQVGPLLSAFAFDHVIGFGARLEVLSLLEDGARGLAGLSGAKKDDASTALAPLSAEDRVRGKRRLVNGASLQTGTGDEVSQKEDGKTRRWGTRKPTVTTQNRFAPKALRAFFRPLLHNLINHCGQKDDDDALLSVGRSATSNIRLRDQDEAMLLAKAIECLCVFVEASGPHGLDSPTMAEELLALAWPLRGSTFPEVRRSVLLCVACGVTTLGMERLMMPTQGGLVMDAMAEWMVVTEEKDPDADCRRIAGLLMAT